MMKLVLAYYDECRLVLEQGGSVDALVSLPVREQIGRFKYVEEAKIQEQYEAILAEMTAEFDEIVQKEAELA